MHMQDPAIRGMAEQIATDPAFQHVTDMLKTSFQDMMTKQATTPAAELPMEPSVYMRAMAAKFDDPEFLAMAQQLGHSVVEVWQSQIVNLSGRSLGQLRGSLTFAYCSHGPSLQNDPNSHSMLELMRDPAYRQKVEDVLVGMQGDTELGPMLEELEKAGPMAMIK